MLTSLDFLKSGEAWPPLQERDRLKSYKYNRLLFEGEHSAVYEEQFKRIQRIIGNFGDVVSYPIIVNFQRLLSLKVADLLLGEPPKIICNKNQEKVNKLILESNLMNIAYEIALDVSRYGTGIFYIHNDETGKGTISITQPSCWFPVVSGENIKNVLYHVLAWTYTSKENGREKNYITMEIHERGCITKRIHEIVDGYIGKRVVEDEKLFTGLDGFAVIPVHNSLTSDRVYGMDDYFVVDSIVSEIEVRMAQISRILDKHSSPTMTGPSSALVEDQFGQLVLKAGNYIPNDAGFDGEKSDVKYITWDAHLDANFKQIERLLNFLSVVSETGSVVLEGETGVSGRAESGTALRLRMISPLAKVQRLRMRFDPALKKAISRASKLGWGDVDISNISIIWQDGLPNDPREEAEIMNIRTGGKATISLSEAIKRLDGVSEEQARDVLYDINWENGKEINY